MRYIRTTPHCGRSCWLKPDGSEYHYHPGKKRRWNGKPCRCEECRPPRDQAWRQRLKRRLRDEGW